MSTISAVTYEVATAVTASDTTADPAGPFAALFTGAGGNIKITTINGQTVVLASAAAGIIIPIATQRVWSTGTAATGIIGLSAPPYKQAINPGAGSVV